MANQGAGTNETCVELPRETLRQAEAYNLLNLNL